VLPREILGIQYRELIAMDNQDSNILGHIYGIKNTVNGFWYIGQTRNIADRKYRHFLHLKQNRHYNKHLQNAYNKYGKQWFEFHILEETNIDMLDMREKSWINYYKSNNKKFGYNKMSGGGSTGFHSEETKQKQREIHKKRILERPETKGGHKKGVPLSEEHKRILSIAAQKRWSSKEERDKQSKKYKGKKQDPIFVAKRAQAIRLSHQQRKLMLENSFNILNN
jgi:group I intron endonuclease